MNGETSLDRGWLEVARRVDRGQWADLADGDRAFYATKNLRGRVMRGGFHTYFDGVTLPEIRLAIDCFREHGAPDIAELIERTKVVLFPNGMPSDPPFQSAQGRSWADAEVAAGSGSPWAQELDSIDNQFYALEHKVDEVVDLVSRLSPCVMETSKYADESPSQSFARAFAAFDGMAVQRGSASDLLARVASVRGADTRITPGGLAVLEPRCRKAVDYWAAFGPAVVAALRLHAPGQTFVRPFEIDDETLYGLGCFRGGPRWFWVSRTADAIAIDCRPAIVGREPTAVPAPLEPWCSRPAGKVFLRFKAPWPCGHCSVMQERYRRAGDALICLACGRSQRVPALELERATVEHAG